MTHIHFRGEEKNDDIKKNKKYLAKRWVVERTNSWHNRFRKLLLVRYEKKSTNYFALVRLMLSDII